MRKNAKKVRYVVIQSYNPVTKLLSDKFDRVVPLLSDKMVEMSLPYFKK